MKRITILALAAAALAAPLATLAQVSVNINVPGLVTLAPPAPRFEPMPGPRPGQVWVPGRWIWTGHAYDWRVGYWQPARADYAYVPGRWIRADGGYRWVEGDWKHAGRHRRHDRDERWDGDRQERHGHHGGHGYHCPPGQAKKGNC